MLMSRILRLLLKRLIRACLHARPRHSTASTILHSLADTLALSQSKQARYPSNGSLLRKKTSLQTGVLMRKRLAVRQARSK
ncbi:hypothetical protein B0T21DRAFT_375907 [Apiosordaria backusii]|uniref:Secreted protein n=1 Tax=Apiosordaria backusii TaxID=314023 RepID=A0AA40AEN5_9PEZI|nr:hypothetical protein B0T21DRAFT_375907 [Apiosordaria backusii]